MKFLLGYNMKIVILWKGINLWSREHKFGEGESTGRIPGEGGGQIFGWGWWGHSPIPPVRKTLGIYNSLAHSCASIPYLY